MGKGWDASEGMLDLEGEGRTEWPVVEIERVGPEKILKLKLSNNKLTSVPGEQLARLRYLRRLWLDNNELTVLPAEIGQLLALMSLRIDNNQLTAIPAEVGQIKPLSMAYNLVQEKMKDDPRFTIALARELAFEQVFCAKNNPLTDLPASVRDSDSAILAYLRSLSSPAVAAPSSSPPTHPTPAPVPAPAPSAPTPIPASTPAPAPDPSVSTSTKAATPPPRGDRNPLEMRVADVCEWLRALDLGKLTPAFEDHSVDGRMLLTLTDTDLREELGVESGLIRRKVLTQIADLARPYGLPVAGPFAPPARPQARLAPPKPGTQHPTSSSSAMATSYDCFISYAHADKARVLPFVDCIEAAGFSVWNDRELLPGRDWLDDIGKAIKQCRCFIAFVSPAYLLSRNCDDELKFAHQQVEPRPPKYPVWLCPPNSVTRSEGQAIMLADNWVIITEQDEARALQHLLAGLQRNLRGAAPVPPVQPKP